MANFPKSEAEVVVLAEAMIAGYGAHAVDFPSVDPASLGTSLGDYKTTRDSQEDARAQAQLATEAKNEKLGELVEIMKNDLKLSEVDTVADPTKLTQIGWGPKSDPSPIIPPNQPANLTPVTEGAGTVTLKWDKPSNGSTGGYVRNYLIQRRDKDSGEFGPWNLLDTVYHEIAELSGQPQQTQMEYRVKASNAAGESLPSNVATVVL